MTKYSLIFSLFLLCTNTAKAQTETLSGVLIKKTWAKTIESFCAGGSDYYVLVANDKTESLLDLSSWRARKINKSLNKQVSLKGSWQSSTKQNDDPYSQHPISPTPCRKFVVNK